MTIKKIMITCCMLPLAFTAIAEEPVTEGKTFKEHFKDFRASIADGSNFIILKGGLDQPTRLGGTSNMGTGSSTYTGGVGIGKKITDIFGLELEYNHGNKKNYNNTDSNTYMNGSPTPASNNSWGVTSNSIMLNASVDLLDEGRIIPYLKAGIGGSKNRVNDYTYTNTTIRNNVLGAKTYTYPGKTEKKLAWQVGAGFDVKMSKTFDAQFQYMFVDRGKIQTEAHYTYSATSTGGVSDSQNAPAITGKLQEHLLTIGFKVKF